MSNSLEREKPDLAKLITNPNEAYRFTGITDNQVTIGDIVRFPVSFVGQYGIYKGSVGLLATDIDVFPHPLHPPPVFHPLWADLKLKRKITTNSPPQYPY